VTTIPKHLCSAAAFAIISIVSTTAYAHQQKESYTSLLFNQRSGNVEVSHRFSIHDAEHVLNVLLDVSGDLSTDAESRNQFAAYIEKNFSIRDDTGKTFTLITIGHEVDEKYFWLYQEIPIPETEVFEVSHTALFDVWPTQINYINVEKNGWVRSARLSQTHSLQTISLLD